jgi:hypothetical protein
MQNRNTEVICGKFVGFMESFTYGNVQNRPVYRRTGAKIRITQNVCKMCPTDNIKHLYGKICQIYGTFCYDKSKFCVMINMMIKSFLAS